jgi:uncharacterized repeat protein (TIGR01451 family)
MKIRFILAAVALGLAILVLALSFLSDPIPWARADVQADTNATIYYVEENGSGTACSKTEPCNTIQQALENALSGDEVWVAGGIYSGTLRVTRPVKLRGGWDTEFTLQNPAQNPTLISAEATTHVLRINTPPNEPVLVENLTLHNGRDGIHIWNSKVTVAGCKIYGSDRQGIEVDEGTVLITNTRILTAQQNLEVDGGTVQVLSSTLTFAREEGIIVEHMPDQVIPDVTVKHSIIEHSGNQGVHINSGRVTLSQNHIRHVISDGIKVDGGTVVITDNVISNIMGYAADGDGYAGIYVRHGDVVNASATIFGNRVHDITGRGIDVRDANVTLEHNVVYATGRQGIFARGGSPVMIGNTVYDTDGDGIRVDEECTSAEIRGNIVYAIGSDGIDARALETMRITDNEVSSTTKHGIYTRIGAATITSNTIHNTGSDGVHTREGSGAAEIHNNTLYAIGSDGIDAREGSPATIRYNHIYDVLKHGIAFSTTATVADNQVYRTGDYGIVARNGIATIIDNRVHHTVGDGIRVEEASRSASVRDNIVYEVGNDGIDVRASMNATISGNRVYTATEQGIYARHTVTIADNHVSNVITHGIYTRDGAATITGNRVYDADADGIHTDDSNTTVKIQANTVSNVGNDGIDARGHQVWVSNNTVTANGDNGIKTEDIGQWVYIEANRVFSNATDGIAVRAAPRFTVTNNVVGEHPSSNLELGSKGADATKQGVVYHNTLVGNPQTRDGKGIVVLDPLTATVVNNIVVSHTVGISVPVGAQVHVSHILLWNNEDDSLGATGSMTPVVSASPQLINTFQRDYHIRSISPALDQGADVGVSTDFEGDPRPQGLAPDLGADEIYTPDPLEIVKSGPSTAAPNEPITYTLTVINHSGLSLTNVVITDRIPNGATFIGASQGGQTVALPERDVVRWVLTEFPKDTNIYKVQFSVTAQQGTIVNSDYRVSCAEGISAVGKIAVETVIQGDYNIYLPNIMRNHPPPPPKAAVPAYQIYANPGDLERLASNPYANETIPATFVHERGWTVDMRYRGDTSRLMPKKSWKLFFSGSDLFRSAPFFFTEDPFATDELNLNADVIDQTLLRSAVGYDFMSRAGLLAPRATHARVYMNGQYQGLYSEVEEVEKRFLYRMGFNIHGNLYKPFYGGLKPVIPEKDYEEWWDRHYHNKTYSKRNHDDLRSFITLIDETPDAIFPETIAGVLDVNGWIDWYAANILLSNFEMIDKNYYIYHDLSTDRWHFLPWDVDLAMGHNAGFGGLGLLFDPYISWDNPLDSGTVESPKIDGKWNRLIDRMMDVNMPEFRYFYGRRLVEMMENEFSMEAMSPRIDWFFEAIEPYAAADPLRWRPDGFTFADGPEELRTYIRNRRAWIYEQLPGFMPNLHPPLVLNEIMPQNTATGADEAGEYDPWIEVYNASTTLTWDLGGMYLSDDDQRPRKWRFPEETYLPPQSTVLVWADGESGEGPLHANFALNASGGTLGLWDRDVFDNATIFWITYPAQSAINTSYGRSPDGDGDLQTLTLPTPGWRNQGRPPIITNTMHTPAFPRADTPVRVTSEITDADHGIEGGLEAMLWYRTFPGGTPPPASYQALTMTQVDAYQWQADIPPHPTGTWVEYYIQAVDTAGMTSVDRPGWPASDTNPPGNYHYVVGWQSPPLVINEIVAINTTFEDEFGETPDWIEIYNTGTADIDMGGMFLTDDPLVPTQYQIPEGIVVPAGGYYVFLAGGQGQGAHLNFGLSGAGEAVALFDRTDRGQGLIDKVYFNPQNVDVAWGRYPNGEARWQVLEMPTPGTTNRPHPPRFESIIRTPRWPAAGEATTLKVKVTSGVPSNLRSPTISLTLWLDVGNGEEAVPLTVSPDKNSLYQAHIPPQAGGTMVSYYLEAVDILGQQTFYPPADVTSDGTGTYVHDRYLVGHRPPAVFINELLADNELVNVDEADEYEDWIELYNAGEDPIALGNMYLTDDLTDPMKWAFPSDTVIQPGAYILIWCDGDVDQGPFHTNFKLSRQGETPALFDSETGLIIDWLAFGKQHNNVSYGRQPGRFDEQYNTNVWSFMRPTPGGIND